MTIDLPQRATGVRKMTPPRPPPGDGANEFSSFAAQLAERGERRRAGIASATPSLSIDRDEARSLFGSRRAGPLWAGVVLLTTVSVAALAVWGLPFQASTPLPSKYIEQAKADTPSKGKLEASVPPSVSAPPAAAPVGAPPLASPRTVSSPPVAPTAASAPVASPPAVSSPAVPSAPVVSAPVAQPPVVSARVAPPPAPKELARSTPEIPPPATQKPVAAQTGSAPLTPDEVRELQGKLKAAGFNPGPIDGVVGRLTRNAVRDYGQAGALANADATKDLLVRLKAEPPAAAPPAPTPSPAVSPPTVAQRGDKPAPGGAAALTSDEIRNLQDRLRAAGYDPGTVDGVMGRQTRSAVREYAEAQGIPKEEATKDLLSR
jgi:peptidoglycan hydrolase-like protein with peptidoglycan-binding domain